MAQGFETRHQSFGGMHQAGFPTPEPRPGCIEGWTLGQMCEAVVLAVYFPEEDTRKAGGRQSCLLVDVRTLGMHSRELSKVRVFQSRHGLWDEDLWIPRPARTTVSGGALVPEGSGTAGKPTRAEDMDGDHVLIAFLDNSIAQPIALPIQAPHPNANTLPTKTSGHVRRIRHNGTLMSWDNKGSWTIDATGAAVELLGSNATETSASGDGGVITLKTKDGSDAESSIVLNNSGGVVITDGGSDTITMTKSTKAVKIDCQSAEVYGSSTATLKGGISAAIDAPLVTVSTAPREPVIKGTAHTTFASASFAALAAYCTLVGNAMDALVNAQGLSNSDKAKVLAAGSSATTAAAGAATAYTGGAASYLSTKVTTG